MRKEQGDTCQDLSLTAISQAEIYNNAKSENKKLNIEFFYDLRRFLICIYA
jgi:NRPS condensation-like uncharacterized protein